MKGLICAWMLVLGSFCYGGEEASVLVSPTPADNTAVTSAPVTSTPTVVVVTKRGCKNCASCCGDRCEPVYSEKVDERSTCRRNVFGKVVRRDVKRTVLTPVR